MVASWKRFFSFSWIWNIFYVNRFICRTPASSRSTSTGPPSTSSPSPSSTSPTSSSASPSYLFSWKGFSQGSSSDFLLVWSYLHPIRSIVPSHNVQWTFSDFLFGLIFIPPGSFGRDKGLKNSTNFLSRTPSRFHSWILQNAATQIYQDDVTWDTLYSRESRLACQQVRANV